MKIGPKYKIARKLGGGIFEKTQTAKFALADQKKKAASKKFARPKSGFGLQLAEKQKVKYVYGLTTKQLGRYVHAVLDSKSKTPAEDLYKNLELRLDNIVLKAGLAKTRFQARQIVSHGHITIDGKRVTIPSLSVEEKHTISVRESRKSSPLFMDFEGRAKDVIVPDWIKVDPKTMTIKIKGSATYKAGETPFDLQEIIQSFKG